MVCLGIPTGCLRGCVFRRLTCALSNTSVGPVRPLLPRLENSARPGAPATTGDVTDFPNYFMAQQLSPGHLASELFLRPRSLTAALFRFACWRYVLLFRHQLPHRFPNRLPASSDPGAQLSLAILFTRATNAWFVQEAFVLRFGAGMVAPHERSGQRASFPFFRLPLEFLGLLSRHTKPRKLSRNFMETKKSTPRFSTLGITPS